MKKSIILANGKPPRKSVIEYLLKRDYSKLICADGGANKAKKMNIVPDFIIGDLDSILPETLKYYSGKCEIIKIERQNDTDVEKCLKYAIGKNYSEVVLLGVTGDRLDHTFCNLGIVLKFFDRIKIKIVAENSVLLAYKGRHTITTVPGETISLYGFDRKTKFKSEGLKYPLDNIPLPFGERESTSNVADGDSVTINIKGGTGFVIRDFNLMRKYDLL